ncbi:flagellar basal body-associated FliL family protein [Halanaerobium sp. Z-7514]|uniref:Flagellar protein FliL n=1 Tax=Halanaerobium polyolivorans TaxID=2886943 RepID=A0AAW4X070_9FIRM|nr:flagellar basal body-associated FliL family protein [Halanaerobium polyolivorans]MCC3145197.1 flagellar basal body-associated FliL family protein [Halanaerobium polyolivorans]
MAEGKRDIKKIIILALLIIVISGVASFTFFTYFSLAQDEGNEESIDDISPNYNAGSFVVNITDNNRLNYVKASIVFELESSDLVDELERREAQIRDRIITALRNQNESILRDAEAKEVRNAIKAEINGLLISGQIKNVWFTELMFQ